MIKTAASHLLGFVERGIEKLKQAREAVRPLARKVVVAAVVGMAAIASAPMAHAQADPSTTDQVNGIVTDAGSLLTAVYPIVIGAVTFGILISLVKMVRRK